MKRYALICLAVLAVLYAYLAHEEEYPSQYKYSVDILTLDEYMEYSEFRSHDRYPAERVLTNAKMAALFASEIFEVLDLDDLPGCKSHAARYVIYDEKQDIWVVQFWNKWIMWTPKTGKVCIAMKAIGAEVVDIWIEG